MVALSVDTSLWLRTDAGAIMKYTAGKLQPYRVSGAVPDLEHADQLLTSASGRVYLLDTRNHRVLVTDRDGSLVKQYVFENDKTMTRIAVDKNETAVTGISSDGRVMRFNLAK